MVLGKLPVPGRPTIWITVGQGLTALVVGAGGGCLDIFTLIYPFLFSFSLSLGEILSQRAVKPKTTNQPTNERAFTVNRMNNSFQDSKTENQLYLFSKSQL